MAESPIASSSEMHIDDQDSSMETEEKKCGSLHNLQECIINSYVQKIISNPSSINFLSNDFNYFDIEKEYNWFLDFIEKCVEPGKTQLTAIIFPVFVHSYLLVLQISSNSEVENNLTRFYVNHVELFENAEGYKEVFDSLYQLKSVQDINSHPYFSKFINMKYTFRASIDVLKSLKSFLEEKNCKALLYIFHFHFYSEEIDIAKSEILKNLYKHDIHKSNAEAIKNNSDMGSMTEVLKQMTGYLPTISKIVISCNFPNFQSVDFNDSGISLAFGYSYVLTADIKKFQDDNYICDMRKIDVGKSVTTVKYVPGQCNHLLVSSDCSIKLIDTKSESVIKHFLERHSNAIEDIDSTDKLFATASTDGSVCLYSFCEEKAIMKYLGHQNAVKVVKFHPNGLYFASGSSDNTVRFWNFERRYSIRSFVSDNSEVHCIAFSSDGKLLATGDAQGIIKIYDIRDNCVLKEMSCCDTFQLNMSRITSLCFSSETSMLAACNYKGCVSMWDARSTKLDEQKSLLFNDTPLLIRSDKFGVWNIVFKENTL